MTVTDALPSGAYTLNIAGVEITVFPRSEFVKERFIYKAGEHATFIGPTQNGKTSLAFECLEEVATPELPAYVAVSKPRDPVTDKWGKRLDYRRVSNWPPPYRMSDLWKDKPSGYLVWPKFGDIDNDVANSAQITRLLLAERYTAGVRNQKAILVLDDTFVKSKILKLDSEMMTLLAMSGAMGIGVWVFVQKPTGAGDTALMSYGNSEHLFLCYDPDKRNRERFDEIGGVDPRLVREIVANLKPYQFLYIKRTGRKMCIVDSK